MCNCNCAQAAPALTPAQELELVEAKLAKLESDMNTANLLARAVKAEAAPLEARKQELLSQVKAG